MTTIHPSGLARMMARQTCVDLIDVRPREEFNRLHIRGARSMPLNQLSPAKVLQERKQAASEPFFIIGRNRALAGIAAGMLHGAGCDRPVVVDGGTQIWETEGLPTVSNDWRNVWGHWS